MADYTLLIEKDGTNKFWHTHNGITAGRYAIEGDFTFTIDGNKCKIVEKNGKSRFPYLAENISIQDNTDAGVIESGFTATTLRDRLRELGYPKENSIEVLGLTTDEIDAIHGASSPSASNPFITLSAMAGVTGLSFQTNFASFPATGNLTTLYIDKALNQLYRWNGSAYVKLNWQNLQSVTDGAGNNITTNEVKAKWFEFYDADNDTYSKIVFEEGSYKFYDSDGILFKQISKDGTDITINVDSGFGLSKGIADFTASWNRTEPDKDGTYAMLDDIAENHAKILASNGATDGKNFHTFYEVDGALYAGERADGSRGARFLQYPDKDDLSTFNYIEMTNAGAGVNGFESIVYNVSDSCFYGMLSNTSKIIKIPTSDISTYTIYTMTDLPSGCTFAGSGGIVTDGTHLYIGTEQTPHAFIIKIQISIMTTVDYYEWSKPWIHSANISLVNGVAIFAQNARYALKVALSDLSPTEYDLGANGITDDFAILDDGAAGYNLAIFGAEYYTDGKGSKVLDFDSGTVWDIKLLPSTGVYYDANTYTVFNCSSKGFIETIGVDDLVASVIDATIPQETALKAYTLRGYWVNELALYWNGTSNEVYCTVWENTTGTGSIKKVELIGYSNALITQAEAYYRYGQNNGGGGISEVNGQTGPVVTLDYSDVGADASGSAAAAETAAKSYADSLVVGLWDDRGSFNASGGSYPSSGGSGTAGAILKGDTWTISVAGTLPTGQVVEVGDLVRALVNTPGNTQANWAIQQNNIGYTAENSANKTDTMVGNTTSSTKYLSAKGVYDWATGLFALASRTINSKALTADVVLNTDDIAESGTPTNKWFTNARAIASTLTSFVSGAGTVSSSDTILQAIQKIVGNIDLKADKSLGAYKMRANNTNATANGTEQVFKAIDKASYGGSITFTFSGSAPSGTPDQTYSWRQIGNIVDGYLSATFPSAGSGVTQCVIPLPTDMPNPIKPTGRTAASEKLYPANGQMMATTTGTTAAAFSSYLRSNSANTGFEIVITMSSGAYKAIDVAFSYPVS